MNNIFLLTCIEDSKLNEKMFRFPSIVLANDLAVIIPGDDNRIFIKICSGFECTSVVRIVYNFLPNNRIHSQPPSGWTVVGVREDIKAMCEFCGQELK